jgi:hypothetical protein
MFYSQKHSSQVMPITPSITECELVVNSLLRILTCTLMDSTGILLELLILYYHSTRAALPAVSPINVGMWHAENAAPCTVARDVTEVTWSFLTVASSSVTAQPSNARQFEASGSEGRQDVIALRYCCPIASFEVSEFQQLPHGAITPQYHTWWRNTDWLTAQVITKWMTFSLPGDTKVYADKMFWTSNKPAQ